MKITVPLKGGYMGFHVSLGECKITTLSQCRDNLNGGTSQPAQFPYLFGNISYEVIYILVPAQNILVFCGLCLESLGVCYQTVCPSHYKYIYMCVCIYIYLGYP